MVRHADLCAAIYGLKGDGLILAPGGGGGVLLRFPPFTGGGGGIRG